MTTTAAAPSLTPATVIPAVGFVAHGRQDGTSRYWWHDPATDRWYLENPVQHLRPPRVGRGSVVLEWALVRGRVGRIPLDDDDAAPVATDSIVYCEAFGPMTTVEAEAWRRDRARDAWAVEVPHRAAPPTVYATRDGEPMSAADVVQRAAQVDLERAVLDGGLWWVSRRGSTLTPEATDPALVLLLERFAPLVLARLRKVDAPPCARCKRPAVTVEVIGARLLCDRHAADPILRPVEPPADWLAERAAMPPALIPEDPIASRRRLAASELEALRMPVPRDMARGIEKRERRAGRGW